MKATNTPIREQPPGTYTCRRCGIQRTHAYNRGGTGYCRDCVPYVKGTA